MKIEAKINLKTIAILFAIVLIVVFIACVPLDPLRLVHWDQATWDVDAWGD